MGSPSPRTGRLARSLVAVSASLALIIGLATVAVAYRWYDLRDTGVVDDDGFGTGVQSQEDIDEPIDTGPCSRRACNYLILGSDSRAGLSEEDQEHFGTNQDIGGEQRADTIMLIHTDPDLQKAIILSFPRDLWVTVPAYGDNPAHQDKINAAFEGGIGGGGAGLMAKTVADLTGLRIDHFLYVDLAGFQGVVDTLGGVEMCPPSYLADPTSGRIQDILTGLDIEPGCQTMDGATALAFVRTRHLPCDNIPDFSRIGRQQQFLRALFTQMLRPTKFAQAPTLVTPVLENLRRDGGLLPGDLVYLVGQMKGLTTGAAEFRAVPGTAGWEGSLSVVHMDPAAEQIFTAIDEGRPISDVGLDLAGVPISPANIPVAVIDANSGGTATDVQTDLGNAGFDVSPGIWAADTTPAGVKGTRIVYAPGHDEEVSVLAAYLPGVKVVESSALRDVGVAVVITGAYEPPAPGDGGGVTAECPAAAT
ncbi:MAG TPA: LCP family protein [Actinomycetota bacterium]|nr:LCP family protein [Actinomycetota bacterium]